MSGGPYDCILFLHSIDCWDLACFCWYFKIIWNLGRVWLAQNTYGWHLEWWPVGGLVSIQVPPPLKNQTDTREAGQRLLVTFQPWTMKVTLNHWLRDEKPLGSTTDPQNCPVPRYRRLRTASRDQKSVLLLLLFKYISKLPSCPLQVPLEGLWNALFDQKFKSVRTKLTYESQKLMMFSCYLCVSSKSEMKSAALLS